MKHFLISAALVGLFFKLSAQNPADLSSPSLPAKVNAGSKGKGKITGIVMDSLRNKPLEFATVALINASTAKPIDGTITDEKGKFSMKAPEGEYQISVSFLSYKSTTTAKIIISGKDSDINLGEIRLSEDAKRLNEVTVTGEQSLIEDKVDRIVYNAEKDLTNTGGNASDVLKKVPMLSVDLEGNVQFRGSSNVKVLINNKPSSIFAANIADALKQIPSDVIKSVEVITSPSAKYDAEGSAGVINIITKKNTLKGLTGTTNAALGNLGSNANTNLNYRAKKMGVTGNIGVNTHQRLGNSETYREDYLSDKTKTLNQRGNYSGTGLSTFLQAGADYDFNEKNTITSSIRMNKGKGNSKNKLSSIYSSNDIIEQQYERTNRGENDNDNLDVNLDYTKTFKNPQQELSILSQYTRSNRFNDFKIEQVTEGVTNSRETSFNENLNEEKTFQIDYTHPFKNKSTLEVGSKAVLRNVDSDYKFYTFDFDQSEFVIRPSRTNTFEYSQDILSSYFSFAAKIKKKYNLKVGTRYEYTMVQGNFISSDTSMNVSYPNLIPSLMLSRDLTKTQKIKINYSRRIQRPNIYYLNPFINSVDPRYLWYGNPNLDPELTHNYEIAYNAYFKGNSINVSFYLRQTNNSIETVRNVDTAGVARTTYQNIGKNNNYGTNIYGSTKITPKWTLNANVSIYYVELNSPSLNKRNSNVAYNFNINSSYKFEKGWSAQIFGYFNSPGVELQGRNSSYQTYNMAVKKEIFKKNGSIGLVIDNPYPRYRTYSSNFETQNSKSNSTNRSLNSSVKLNFSYKFGKLKFEKTKPRRKSISNDDVKQGGN